MIFDSLHESSQRGELMLIDGGFCHWHLRRDGQLTIREIISTKRGAGWLMLERLKGTAGASSIYAKCPAELPSNGWYLKRGFTLESVEHTKSGKALNCYRLQLDPLPEVTPFELIYCADGNARYQQIAIDAGWLSGARLPATVYYRPYFADNDYKHPDRAAYMAGLAKHKPRLATVLDHSEGVEFCEVMEWATEAVQYCQTVIIIPKVPGYIERIPETIAGKPVRLGYSVASSYGETLVHISEFGARPVHLLGGNPHEQMRLARVMNVKSVDCNYHQKIAHQGVFYARRSSGVNWQTLKGAGLQTDVDMNYRAFKYSCENIAAEWKTIIEAGEIGSQPAPAKQLSLAI